MLKPHIDLIHVESLNGLTEKGECQNSHGAKHAREPTARSAQRRPAPRKDRICEKQLIVSAKAIPSFRFVEPVLPYLPFNVEVGIVFIISSQQ